MKLKSAQFVLILEIIVICVFHAVKISNETKISSNNQVLKLYFDKRNISLNKYSLANVKW